MGHIVQFLVDYKNFETFKKTEYRFFSFKFLDKVFVLFVGATHFNFEDIIRRYRFY